MEIQIIMMAAAHPELSKILMHVIEHHPQNLTLVNYEQTLEESLQQINSLALLNEEMA